ncbi:MAG: alpha-L-arabinofuranosidase C-terminal domain-containing protein [Nibricoccus sp.]
MTKLTKINSFIFLGSVTFTAHADVLKKESITIDLQKKGAEVAPSMYGVFFEEINHAGDGGLYAELVQNRSFEEREIPKGFRVEGTRLIPPPVKYHLTGEVRQIEDKLKWNMEPVRGWALEVQNPSAASMELTKDRPRFDTAPNNLEIAIKDASDTVSVVNEGYWGMGLEAGNDYLLRTIIRVSDDYKGTVKARLLSAEGKKLAECVLDVTAKNTWQDIRAKLTPSKRDARAKLALVFDAPGKVWLDYVSLFPKATFHGRTNGLRKDVAQIIADMKPAFVRWPGGSIVGGITLDTRFKWKETMGDPAERPGEYFTWGYRCSYGFGYLEMLQFCEDIGADAMFVCSVGLGCQYRMGDASPEEDIPSYINECLDAIEYAVGDTSTTWGARRAADGHPAPFRLKYVEVGNEHWGKEYDRRFVMFYDAIKKRYPDLSVIYNGMMFSEKSASKIKADIVDPHMYETAEGFYRSNAIYDNHPRGKYQVYLGEYACNFGVGAGNMSAALSEAAFIGGMERNGDLVTMTSYAPLLENEHDRRWSTNLIWLNSETVIGRSSYYVQKLASLNRPSYNVWSNFTQAKPQPAPITVGVLGLGSLGAQVEFKDVKVTENGKVAFQGVPKGGVTIGNWKNKDGLLAYEPAEKRGAYFFDNIRSNNFTLECKARKISGKDGFILYYGGDEKGEAGYMVNIAGGNNISTYVQRIENSATVSSRVPHSLSAENWYNLVLSVTPNEVKLYVDGKLLLTHKPETIPLQFLASGYDDSTNELVLKVVNGSAYKFPTNIQLKGASKIEPTGKVTSLSATSETEENSFKEPQKIFPKESEFKGFKENFDYEFPSFSYTILRIKAGKVGPK